MIGAAALAACPAPTPDTPLVAGLSAAVDCGVRLFAQSGYEALTRPPSPLPAIITALLTLYVALVGWGMLQGRGPRLADTPQLAFRIGAILALTASWPLFQTLVFRIAFDGAAELAGVLTGPGPALWDELQLAYDQLVALAAAFGAEAGSDAQALRGGPAAAAEALWGASAVLLASSLGVTLAAKIVIGLLTAVGPIFIGLFLLDVTRGAFLGWLRALVAAALMPLTAALGLGLLLFLLQPRLALLADAQAAGRLDLSTAVAASALIHVAAAAQAMLLAAMGFIGLGLKLKPEPSSQRPGAADSGAKDGAQGVPRQPDRIAAVAEAARLLEARDAAQALGARRIEIGAQGADQGAREEVATQRLGQLNRRIGAPVARREGSR